MENPLKTLYLFDFLNISNISFRWINVLWAKKKFQGFPEENTYFWRLNQSLKDALIWRIFFYFWTIFNLIASYFLRISIHILDSVSLFKNCYMDFLKSMLEYFYMVWKIKTLDFSCFFSTHIAAEVVRPNQTFFCR